MIAERLRQARIVAAMTQNEVVEALRIHCDVKLTKAGLSKYERGGSIPKPTVLRALAKVLGVTVGFFLEPAVIKVRWLAFRKAMSLAGTEQERIKAVAVSQVEAFLSLSTALEPNRHCRKIIPQTVKTPEDAETAAAELRKQWRLGEQPIESVTTVIENAGGIVLEIGDHEDLFDGLAGWAGETDPVIVVSPSVSDDRRRFSLAHELGHLYMDVGAVDERTEERLAHRFAAAFMVPAATVRRELGAKRRHLDLRELAILKLKYGLSMQAWVYRASDLGIIDAGHKRTLFAEFTRRGWRKSEPIKFEGRERPIRLKQLAVRAFAEGLLSRTQTLRICPEALHDLDGLETPTVSSMDPRNLMKLSRTERDRLLEQAATLAEQDYKAGSELTYFDANREEDESGLSER